MGFADAANSDCSRRLEIWNLDENALNIDADREEDFPVAEVIEYSLEPRCMPLNVNSVDSTDQLDCGTRSESRLSIDL
jgi:hypothetical protein